MRGLLFLAFLCGEIDNWLGFWNVCSICTQGAPQSGVVGLFYLSSVWVLQHLFGPETQFGVHSACWSFA